MDNKQKGLRTEQPGFEFNWKNRLVIWLIIVLVALGIGYRSKMSRKQIGGSNIDFKEKIQENRN